MRDLVKLVLLDLDQSQPPLGIRVRNSLDGRGFSGARVSVQKGVRGRTPFDQRKRVVDHHLPFPLVSAKLRETDGVGMLDRNERARFDHEGGVFRKDPVSVFVDRPQTAHIDLGKIERSAFPSGQKSGKAFFPDDRLNLFTADR